MSRILYLVRHAEAEGRQPHQTDKERELTEKGKQDAIQLGDYLKSINTNINLIISSPAHRALSTAYWVAKQISFEMKCLLTEECIYSGNTMELVKMVGTIPESVTEIMLVGHYPTIVELYNYLITHESKPTMSTCELCSINFDIPWSEVTCGSGFRSTAFYPNSI
jgi:phosphohistidine phosphatase